MTGVSAADETLLALAQVVEKHLPTTAVEVRTRNSVYNRRSVLLASRIVAAHKTPLWEFGLGPKQEKWEDLRRASSGFLQSLGALTPDGLLELDAAVPDWWDDESGLGLSAEAFFSVHAVMASAMAMSKERGGSKAPGGKRNWGAVAVTKVAREIWAEEHWPPEQEEFRSKFDPLPTDYDGHEWSHCDFSEEYLSHLENFAPKYDKHDHPGPFGRFLNDLLGVFSEDISAASALRSLKQALHEFSSRKQKP